MEYGHSYEIERCLRSCPMVTILRVVGGVLGWKLEMSYTSLIS